jgi:hypothetical protein
LALPVSGGWNYHVFSWPTYHQMSPDTRIKDMYGLGVEISRPFEIFGHFLFQGDGTTT